MFGGNHIVPVTVCPQVTGMFNLYHIHMVEVIKVAGKVVIGIALMTAGAQVLKCI